MSGRQPARAVGQQSLRSVVVRYETGAYINVIRYSLPPVGVPCVMHAAPKAPRASAMAMLVQAQGQGPFSMEPVQHERKVSLTGKRWPLPSLRTPASQ